MFADKPDCFLVWVGECVCVCVGVGVSVCPASIVLFPPLAVGATNGNMTHPLCSAEHIFAVKKYTRTKTRQFSTCNKISLIFPNH